ncbi:MAG: acyl-CoA dehydrogenase [Planctomycetes bacterium]|nr:acyl-CoA dehydrogenase [Planctomycetota bacterium]
MTKSPSEAPPRSSESFAETALRLGGKSDDEARRTGAVDRADDQVDQLFKRQRQTAHSPIHRAIWNDTMDWQLFRAPQPVVSDAAQRVMDESIRVASGHRTAGSLFDEQRKVSPAVLRDLAAVGYWGLLVQPEYGGTGVSFQAFASFLSRMAQIDPTISGMASVHGCIGAVDPVQTFGTPEQKRRILPGLASGERLSAFALTEPAAGSDLTALRTTARREGDTYYVTGEKLFITNVVPGRTIGLVCLIDGRPAVLVCDLPQQESAQFQLRQYGLYALKHTHNQGMVFREFPVPAGNLLVPHGGNGLTIAYHGLNLGRIALCANAAGTMRQMLASMLPWARFRVTYGEPIARRELVRRRLGRLAGLIVACDALVNWCASLIDQGFRGEMECIVAKIFGSEALKEAAVELLMKTHGGRSFLHGHLFGDNVHEYLAPCIYEGEGEMLGMAFFKSLVKQHGATYFEPIGKAMASVGLRQLSPLQPGKMMGLLPVLTPYLRWWIGRSWKPSARPQFPSLPPRLRRHAEFAATEMRRQAVEISAVMRKFQLKLADRQCRMSELSTRVQKLAVILCTSFYAADQSDELVADAADLICQELAREYRGQRPADAYFRDITRLGEQLLDRGVSSFNLGPGEEVLMPYSGQSGVPHDPD